MPMTGDKVCLHKAGGPVPDPVRGRAGSEAVLQPAAPADPCAGLAGRDEDHAGRPGTGDSRTVPGRQGGILYLWKERGADRHHLSGRKDCILRIR